MGACQVRQKRIRGGITYAECNSGQEGGSEGRSKVRVGGGSNERARGSDGMRKGGSGSGGREGRLIKGTSEEGT